MQRFQSVCLKIKTSCRVSTYLVSLTLMYQCNILKHTSTHNSHSQSYKRMFYLFFLFENKHFAEVTNLVINFIYHISTTFLYTYFLLILASMQWGGEVSAPNVSLHELNNLYCFLYFLLWGPLYFVCKERRLVAWYVLKHQTISGGKINKVISVQ